ncbi:STAS domain-containing protein [Streptomyces sp. H10-C2]|uniref:STAS domain-containing protein n=1 Tax=unclassified Streptomyces TaxID=2593676 RepID=UPI0024B8F489|nr:MULTISPECIES: STAS domain-containing protein [unclassified Streptomyces]MDJ0343797.1 STAS domain-containing protein [Streptomyces sp. PH10-H1]MDJ0373318.1 STAS domain-containing protein [Streptomyces sp. H10-C2]
MSAADELPGRHEGERDGRPDALVWVLDAPLTRAGIPALCARLRARLHGSEGGWVTCDVAALTEPDAGTVEALARLQLTARRLGSRIRLRNAGGRLCGLLALAGLRDVLPLEPGPDVTAPDGRAARTSGTDERCRGSS